MKEGTNWRDPCSNAEGFIALGLSGKPGKLQFPIKFQLLICPHLSSVPAPKQTFKAL